MGKNYLTFGEKAQAAMLAAVASLVSNISLTSPGQNLEVFDQIVNSSKLNSGFFKV